VRGHACRKNIIIRLSNIRRRCRASGRVYTSSRDNICSSGIINYFFFHRLSVYCNNVTPTVKKLYDYLWIETVYYSIIYLHSAAVGKTISELNFLFKNYCASISAAEIQSTRFSSLPLYNIIITYNIKCSLFYTAITRTAVGRSRARVTFKIVLFFYIFKQFKVL